MAEGTGVVKVCVCCAFWKDLGVANEGECRKYAPRPLILATTDVQRIDGYWPKTRESEWCGEWKREDV